MHTFGDLFLSPLGCILSLDGNRCRTLFHWIPSLSLSTRRAACHETFMCWRGLSSSGCQKNHFIPPCLLKRLRSDLSPRSVRDAFSETCEIWLLIHVPVKAVNKTSIFVEPSPPGPRHPGLLEEPSLSAAPRFCPAQVPSLASQEGFPDVLGGF